MDEEILVCPEHGQIPEDKAVSKRQRGWVSYSTDTCPHCGVQLINKTTEELTKHIKQVEKERDKAQDLVDEANERATEFFNRGLSACQAGMSLADEWLDAQIRDAGSLKLLFGSDKRFEKVMDERDEAQARLSNAEVKIVKYERMVMERIEVIKELNKEMQQLRVALTPFAEAAKKIPDFGLHAKAIEDILTINYKDGGLPMFGTDFHRARAALEGDEK